MFWGKEFLGNKRKIPAFLFQEHLFLSSSLADMMAGTTTEVPIIVHAHLCVWVSERKSKIYIFFFLFFFWQLQYNLVLVLFLFNVLKLLRSIHILSGVETGTQNLQCYFLLCERVSFERGDWFVFLVSEWLVDDGSVGGRGWGAAGKPTVPEFEALVV